MTFDAAPHLAGLKEFQRRTVDHIIDRFYGPAEAQERSGRFLVADETGLGKSIVARGVIARSVEHLAAQGRHQVTVLYICSNHDLARQNLRRLNITDSSHAEFATRLTLLSQHPELLDGGSELDDVHVNLVSFTPGTSLHTSRSSWRSGMSRERALLAVLLEEITDADAAERRAGCQLLHGASQLGNFARQVDGQREEIADRGIDQGIRQAFEERIRRGGELEDFLAQRQHVLFHGEPEAGESAWNRRWDLIAALRAQLARAGADALEPDLVILDEFQRFRQLLAAEGSPDDNEGAELARVLFEHQRANVLLLSATPYAPFTQSGEEEDHHRDFLRTIDFLHGHRPGARDAVRSALDDHRRALTGVSSGSAPSPDAAAARVRDLMLPVMSRWERPPLAEQTDLVDVVREEAAPPTADDFSDWILLTRLAHALGTRVSPNYWKSIPHFSTFMDGYQIGQQVRERTRDGDLQLRTLLRPTTRITRTDVDEHRPLDLGHGYLRKLAEETVQRGWWCMLWLPPSLPYTTPGPIYRELVDQQPTKRLIFSAWSAVPTAVASLLSYEADRQIIAELREQLPPDQRRRMSPADFRGRLGWPVRDDRTPGAMNSLALFGPHPDLAEAGDPLALSSGRSEDESRVLSIAEHLANTERRLLARYAGSPDAALEVWEAWASGPDSPTSRPGTTWLRRAESSDREENRGWELHLERAEQGPSSPQWHPDLPHVAAFSPGSIAHRCLRRLNPSADPTDLSRAAWLLSLGLRRLFSRGDTARLLTALYGMPTREKPYWRQIIDYCADGGLEAVLDEYLFQLTSEHSSPVPAGEDLLTLAERAVEGMSLLPARYVGHDYTADEPTVPFSARFALRYGGRHQTDQSDADARRQGEARSSFNSPFPPFVLASTSVGQEGIDLHWWCHCVVHWNLPSNPVDFEQREGRVNRYAGHAVRRNIAHHHGREILASPPDDPASSANPWRRAFLEAESRPSDHGSFSPWWVYPGPSRIQRVIMAYPHSRDLPRYERLRDQLTGYRLTLGQPRQEDLLEVMRHGEDGDGEVRTIDLTPPHRGPDVRSPRDSSEHEDVPGSPR